MSSRATAIHVEGLSKRYWIPSPTAPALADYMRRPRSAFAQSRRLEIEALCDVGFEVREGEVFGIIGRNGAGKSTLLKILSRITKPTSGRAMIRGRVASLLEVGTGFHPELTGRENVYLNGMLLGMRSAEVDRVFDQIVEFAGVGRFVNVPIKRYSSGMQLRLAFSVAAHLAADTMILDEVLAVGDAEFQAKCTAAMQDAGSRGRTTLFVSHNMAAVEHLCDRVMFLEHGRVCTIGDPHEVVRQYLGSGTSENAGEREFTVSDEPSAAKALRIVRVRVDGPNGGAPMQGEELLVQIELDARETIRRAHAMVSLMTTDGQPVLATSNMDYRDPWNLEVGRHRIEVRLPAVRLTPRGYRVSIKVFLRVGGEVLDEVTDAATFHVQGRDVLGSGVMLKADRGPTWTPAQFVIESLVHEAAL
jgi:lipopolysaccharide transport system ATP-binding protein